MKELKQIGYVHFYVPKEAESIFMLITEICKGIEQYVSAVRCEKNYGEIEFKYSPYVSHYSVKCGFNNHHVLLMDVYHPSHHIKFSGIGIFDFSKYNSALYDEHQISILHNKIIKNIKIAFTNTNQKNNGDI